MRIPFRRMIALLLLAAPTYAAELEIRYGALERLVAEQMFTAEGRRYVRGDTSDKCRYAYLEHPRLAGAGELLRLLVRFSGRSALNLFGNCVGLGDSFDLTVWAKPVAQGSAITFDQLQVSTPRDSYYIKRVRSALVDTFHKNFRIDVTGQARRLLEAPRANAAYQQELKDLKLRDVRVTKDALVLDVDFKLIVK